MPQTETLEVDFHGILEYQDRWMTANSIMSRIGGHDFNTTRKNVPLSFSQNYHQL